MSHKNQYEMDFEKFVWNLPSIAQLDNSLRDRNSTCLVCIAGFEPRCYTAANRFLNIGWKFQLGFCVHYEHEEMREVNEKHTDKLYESIRKLTNGKEPINLQHEIQNFGVDFGDTLIRTLSSSGLNLNSPETTITFDISVGSSRLLLEGLCALLNTDVKVNIVYSESGEYRPYFDEFLSELNQDRIGKSALPEFLSYGVDRVELIKRIPGINADARPTYLVTFPSFSPIRIGSVIEEISPSRVYWLFGVPHLVKNRWRIDAQRRYHEDLIESFHRHCYVSTFDYRETLNVLENIYKKHNNEFTILISSLGSKLQKVGQTIFHLLRPEVGAIASIPRVWDPHRYSSEKAREVYLIQLGESKELRDQLWRTRMYRI